MSPSKLIYLLLQMKTKRNMQSLIQNSNHHRCLRTFWRNPSWTKKSNIAISFISFYVHLKHYVSVPVWISMRRDPYVQEPFHWIKRALFIRVRGMVFSFLEIPVPWNRLNSIFQAFGALSCASDHIISHVCPLIPFNFPDLDFFWKWLLLNWFSRSIEILGKECEWTPPGDLFYFLGQIYFP